MPIPWSGTKRWTPRVPRELALFATAHDSATRQLCSEVFGPLTAVAPPFGADQEFRTHALLEESATLDNLHRVFEGATPNGPPALLFTGTHGLAFDLDQESERLASQGAIVCQDRAADGGPQCFDAAHLGPNAKIHGMVHFLFACFGAGWPAEDTFRRTEETPVPIAAKPGIARLPQALLSHPAGGALAVIGHIDLAWAYSFRNASGDEHPEGLTDVLESVMDGDRLGNAVDQLNLRWSVLSASLSEMLHSMGRGKRVPDPRLAARWIERDDARNYIIFGDPAVRLRVDEMPVLPAPD